MFLHTAFSKNNSMIGKVEIIFIRIPEVGPHDDNASLTFQGPEHPLQEISHFKLCIQMLQEIRDKYSIEIILRQVYLEVIADDGSHFGGCIFLDFFRQVDGPTFFRRYMICLLYTSPS